jgi:hypothetical protein
MSPPRAPKARQRLRARRGDGRADPAAGHRRLRGRCQRPTPGCAATRGLVNEYATVFSPDGRFAYVSSEATGLGPEALPPSRGTL